MLSKVKAYLAHRRALGFQLKGEGLCLLDFARYVDALGHKGPLTNRLVVKWACRPKSADRLWWARRLEIVRTFAKQAPHSGPATALLGASPSSPVPTPVHRRATPATATLCRPVEGATSTSYLADADRLVGLQWAAHLGGAPTKDGRCGLAAILTDHSRKQVRQDSLRSLTPERAATFAHLCSTPTEDLSSCSILLRFRGGQSSGSEHGWTDLFPIARRYSF